MGCDYKTSDQLIACTGQPALFSEQAVTVYVDRVGAQGGTNNWVRNFAIAACRLNAIPYGRVTPGDCKGQVKNNPNVGAALAATGVKLGLSAVPVVGNALSALANFLPFAHHAQAVQNEQQTLCDVTVNYAGFRDAINSALSTGAIPLQDAIVKAQQIFKSLHDEAESVAKPYNSGYGVAAALDALQLMNVQDIYPSLVPGALGQLTSSTGGKVGIGLLLGGASAVGLKLFGIL
jgi:hypothetical protein